MHPSDYHGLINQGATCYLNSVLQVLFMTEDFREAIFSCEDSTTGSIDPHLKRLFDHLKRCTTYPEGIKRELGIDKVFGQRDAAEYFERILSLTSPNVSQIFKGQLRHSTTCSECDKHSDVENPFWTLPLALEDAQGETYSVSDGFEAFLRPSEVSGDNKLYCDKCNAKANATIGCEIAHYPEVLTLLLKRFTFDYCSMSYVKINSDVNLPQMLKKENHTYDLYAVVHHSGSLRGGHYNTTIKTYDKREWYHFDDNSVSRINEQPFEACDTERSHSAYMLMYRKRKGSQTIENVKPEPRFAETRTSVSSPGDGGSITGGVGADVRKEEPEGPVYLRHHHHHDHARKRLEKCGETEERVREKGQVAGNTDGRQRGEDNEASCAPQTGQWRMDDCGQMTEKWTKTDGTVGEDDRGVGRTGKNEIMVVERQDDRRKDHKNRREGVSTSVRRDLSKDVQEGSGGKDRHVQKAEEKETRKRQNSGQRAGEWQPMIKKGVAQTTRREDVVKSGNSGKVKKGQSNVEENPRDKHKPKAEPQDILSEVVRGLSLGKPAIEQSKKYRTKWNNVEIQDGEMKSSVDSIEKTVVTGIMRKAAQGGGVEGLSEIRREERAVRRTGEKEEDDGVDPNPPVRQRDEMRREKAAETTVPHNNRPKNKIRSSLWCFFPREKSEMDEEDDKKISSHRLDKRKKEKRRKWRIGRKKEKLKGKKRPLSI